MFLVCKSSSCALCSFDWSGDPEAQNIWEIWKPCTKQDPLGLIDKQNTIPLELTLYSKHGQIKGCAALNACYTHFSWWFHTLLVGYHPAKGWGASFQYDSNEMDISWVNTISERFSFDWNELKVLPYCYNIFFQGGGRKKKFAEDEDFDDSEEGSEMSDSEFEDPDEMEVGLKSFWVQKYLWPS